MSSKRAKLASDKAKFVIPTHNCPECSKELELRMRMPRRTMVWSCKSCDYSRLKVQGDCKPIFTEDF